jgi:hypothetical protein
MPNFNFLKGADGKIDVGSAIGFVLAVAAAVFVASKVPGLKKVV